MTEKNYSVKELLATIETMNQEIIELESKKGEDKWLAGALRRRTHDLSERMKELECLYGLLQLSVKQENPFCRGAEKMIQIIREGWQYPEATCVRIKWDKNEVKSLNFSDCRTRQVEPIVVGGKRRGEIEVGYTADKPSIWQGPFLKEEAKLLRAISLFLSLLITRID